MKEVSIKYSPKKASAYGMTLGSIRENGIFKRMEDDCTNFVSQCIWAGYGGTDGYSLKRDADIEQLRKRVADNYRQTPIWFGRNAASNYALGSYAFIRVKELWEFVTKNQSFGPRGNGYNDNKPWFELKVPIEQGDVLQFYNSRKGRYAHTTMVSSAEPKMASDALYNIYVSQHSYDHSYRVLADVLEASDGIESGKMRLIKLKEAKFMDS